MPGSQMTFMNPHYFSAILDGIPHRFILILECECVQGNEEFSPPRFSVGAMNGTRDPRVAQFKQLLEVGVLSENLQIPPTYLMAHQYIYVVHDGTDEHGWQYRNDWNANIISNFNKENDAWSGFHEPHHFVRRRIWMTTIVPRFDLLRAKRLLSENCRVDAGHICMQGELNRYEKGAMSKSWQKRKVTLFHNRMEFYSGSNKKGEVNLTDCEVKMLFEQQCPGKDFAFSIRNPLGTVGVLLDAENQDARRAWVLAIQYQLSMNAHEMNFPPLEYGPPTGEEPDNRVFMASELGIYSTKTSGYLIRVVHLLNRELVLFDGEDMTGRIFLEKALVLGEDNKGVLLSVKSFSGIQFNFEAESTDLKANWLAALRRQIQFIEHQKLKLKTTPAEEQGDDQIPIVDRICQFYDGNWTAPAVDGEDEEYLERVFSAASENHPNHIEFCEEGTSNNHNNTMFVEKVSVTETFAASSTTIIGANNSSLARKPSFRQEGSPAGAGAGGIQRKASFKEPSLGSRPPSLSSMNGAGGPSSPQVAGKGVAQSSPTFLADSKRSSSGTLKPASSFLNLHQASAKLIDTRRSLINPKCVLNALGNLTHRFVLVLECESRVPPTNAQGKPARPNPVTVFPARFTVGGARACRDPRVTPLDQLLAISNINPEIQLPTGWLMLHQYIHIIQQNTDENGWQYRSDWSNGTVAAKDEQWSEVCNEDKYVRRRLWMTTVVKKEDLIKAKRLLADSLDQGVNKEAVLQGNLYVHDERAPAVGDEPVDSSSSLAFVKRRVILYHNRLECFLGSEKTAEYSLADCQVAILVGSQCPGRRHAFSLRSSDGSVALIFDGESRESRLRWVRFLYYQLAITHPDVNFAPLIYGPPNGDVWENKPIYAGELNKQNEFKKWMKYQFVLKVNELLFYNRDVLKGRLFLDGAVLIARDDDQELTVKTASGLSLSVRADSMDLKNSWVRAIRHQIQACENVPLRAQTTPAAEQQDPLAPRERVAQYHDEGWAAPDEDDAEDVAYMQSLVSAMRKNRFEFLEDDDIMLSASTNSNVSSNSIRTVEEEIAAGRMAYSPRQDRHHDSSPNLNLYGGAFAGDVKDDKKFKYVHWEHYPLFTPAHTSLMAQTLTPEMFADLNRKHTHKRYTLSNLIMDGVLNPEECRVGINVGDAECYGAFGPLLVPVVARLHHGHNYNTDRHATDLSLAGVSMTDKSRALFREHVSFIRINCVRNFTGYSFLCGTIDSERIEIENMLYKLFSLFRNDAAGEYFKLDQLTQTQKEFLDDCSFLFEVPVERYVTTGTGSGADRAYPHNRGIFVNTTRSTYIWVNEEDHARIIVTDSGSDILGVFGQFVRLHQLIEEIAKKLGHSFMRNDQLGYLSSNLAFLGTGMKISVLVHLPHFNALMIEGLKNGDTDAVCLLEDICRLFQMSSAGEDGVHTPAREDKFDVFNTEYLGVTEAEVVGKLIACVTSLLEFDALLANGATVAEIREILKKPNAGAAKISPKSMSGMRSAGSGAGSANGHSAAASHHTPAEEQVFESKSVTESTFVVTPAPEPAKKEPEPVAARPRPALQSSPSMMNFTPTEVKPDEFSIEAIMAKMREAERIMNQPVQRAPTPEPVIVNNVEEVNNEENTETINNTKHTEVRNETFVSEKFETTTNGNDLQQIMRSFHFGDSRANAQGGLLTNSESEQPQQPAEKVTHTTHTVNVVNVDQPPVVHEQRAAPEVVNQVHNVREVRQVNVVNAEQGQLPPSVEEILARARAGQTSTTTTTTVNVVNNNATRQEPPAATEAHNVRNVNVVNVVNVEQSQAAPASTTTTTTEHVNQVHNVRNVQNVNVVNVEQGSDKPFSAADFINSIRKGQGVTEHQHNVVNVQENTVVVDKKEEAPAHHHTFHEVTESKTLSRESSAERVKDRVTDHGREHTEVHHTESVQVNHVRKHSETVDTTVVAPTPAATHTHTTTTTRGAPITQAQLNEALQHDSDDDDYSSPKVLLPLHGSYDEAKTTTVPKNTPVAAAGIATTHRRSADDYIDSSDEEEEEEPKPRSRPVSARNGHGHGRTHQREAVEAVVDVAAVAAAASKDNEESSSSSSESESEEDSGVKAARAALQARVAANVAAKKAAESAPAESTFTGGGKTNSLIASLFNKQATAESVDLKSQFLNKSSVEKPAAPSPVQREAAVPSPVEIKASTTTTATTTTGTTHVRKHSRTDSLEAAPVASAPSPVPAGRNFVLPPSGPTRRSSLEVVMSQETHDPQELDTVHLSDINNLDRETGEIRNRHSLLTVEEQRQKDEAERLVALRHVEVQEHSHGPSAAEEASPAYLVKLRSVANPSSQFVSDIQASAGEGHERRPSGPVDTEAYLASTRGSLEKQPSSVGKLSVETYTSGLKSSQNTPNSRSVGKLNMPAAFSNQNSPSTDEGPKRLVKLRSVEKPYEKPYEAPAVEPSAAPIAVNTPPKPKEVVVAPLVPSVPAPFVPSQSVKLKSVTTTTTSSSSETSTATEEPAESTPKPFVKLRNTSILEAERSPAPAASEEGADSTPKPFVKLRNTSILDAERNAAPTNEVHIRSTATSTATERSPAPAPFVKLRSSIGGVKLTEDLEATPVVPPPADSTPEAKPMYKLRSTGNTLENSPAPGPAASEERTSEVKPLYGAKLRQTSISMGEGATLSPAPAAEKSTEEGAKPMFKLRSTGNTLVDKPYEGPPVPVAPAAEKAATPAAPKETTTPVRRESLIPSVPAPFVASQSVKLKSVNTASETSSAATTSEEAGEGAKPLVKLRSTGNSLSGNSPQPSPAPADSSKNPFGAKLRSTSINLGENNSPAPAAAAEKSPTERGGDAEKGARPMFKLRSTGFGLTAPPNPDNDAGAVGATPPPRTLSHQSSMRTEQKAPASFVPKSTGGTGVLANVKLRSTGILESEKNATPSNEVHVKASVTTGTGEKASPAPFVKLRSSVGGVKLTEGEEGESEARTLDMNQ